MESYVMTVVCRSHVSSLARIVSVLHARRATVSALHFVEGPATSQVIIDVSGDGPLLAAQLRRAVDVVSVDVSRPVVAVAS